ncbi:hypothetical protein [Cellulosimicrobium composti]|uniref:Uncharacterized protein n=1 Tax=Cellulosimicrobium composti TaxID=2672572 RepID=A0ABX0BBC7_9MICO|nr:hypothetical protein [Cellulosimicrobium composti]NDO88856.1 hypothetical protein [Cellulosimicrobium composti]TWG78314.1 hypothetical protein L603_000500000950 [Cellulosimicrobium cellulans J34]SMF06372.1 hypothetical protein SAMN02744115_01208 [Cellulosimicrobium cellulans J1]
MSVYLAWTEQEPDGLDGPWSEARAVAPGLLLVESTASLSTVYHALKWSLPHGAALLVTPVDRTPKLRGLAPGTTTWLRDRTRPAEEA